MMNAGIAEMMRVTVADAECLLNGRVCESVANALGTQPIHIQSYIDTGSAAPVFADRLGMDTAAAEDMGNRLGRKGRIGLIVGMLLD